MFEEGRYAGLGSPCTTEKLGICPFEEGGPIQRAGDGCAFSHVRRFCSPSLALLKAVCARRVLTFHCCPHLSFALLSARWPWCTRGHTAGVYSLPVSGRVDQKRRYGLCDGLLCLCWTAPFCCNFSTKYSVVCFVTSLL